MYVSILISTYVKCTISIIIDNFPAQGLDEKWMLKIDIFLVDTFIGQSIELEFW